jgi:Arc/MetJ-type ribon-helix-helix transcriptional regulator
MAGKKVVATITIDPEIAAWIDKEIERKRFANRTHAIEYCLHQVMTKEEAKIRGEQGNHEAPASA